ncbi:MAG: hypothetical protein ACOZQL_32365 [Myxococcota bacterium]
MRRRWFIAGLVVLLAVLASATVRRRRPFPDDPRDDARAAELQRKARVILITLDGPVREDVFSLARLPKLHEAVGRGGVLLPAQATSPFALSLPGYQALAAGRDTGCRDNDCPRIGVETMGERVARRLSLTAEQVAVFASWSRQRRAASSRDGLITVDAPEDQQPADPGPPWRNARWDKETFAKARAFWEQHHPRFLHLAFLDTDELAHADLREEYEVALHQADARISEVLSWVSALPEDERRVTTVLITADHGRGQSRWTEHGFFDRGSGDIFIAAIGEQVRRDVRVEDAEQKDVRPTVERLFGLCPDRVDDEGRALEAVVGGLPCR